MYTPVKPSFTIKKWGLRGSKLYRHVFAIKILICHLLTFKCSAVRADNIRMLIDKSNPSDRFVRMNVSKLTLELKINYWINKLTFNIEYITGTFGLVIVW